MISVKDAINRVFAFVEELEAPGWEKGARLEEVDQDEVKGNDVWLITLSVPRSTIDVLGVGDRTYKVFAVAKETGEVLSMKIREFAGMHV